MYDLFNILTRRNNFTTSQLQDVIVSPTEEQIENATQNIMYDSSLVELRCPISLESFEEEDEICIIKHCGHVFKRASLMSWFQRNVRCPVCRYDIREYPEEQSNRNVTENRRNTTRNRNNNRTNATANATISSDTSGNNTTSNNATRNTNRNNNQNSTFNSDNISNYLRNYLRNEISRTFPSINNTINELVLTFDIPLDYDISYNS